MNSDIGADSPPQFAPRSPEFRRRHLADETIRRCNEERIPQWVPWEVVRQKCAEDIAGYVDYLCEAMVFSRPELFTEYVVWASDLYRSNGVPDEVLPLILRLLRSVVEVDCLVPMGNAARRCLNMAIDRISDSRRIPNFLRGEGFCDVLARDYLAAMLRGESETAHKLILDAADRGLAVSDIYLKVFQPVQRQLGSLWQMNRIPFSQEHYCTACTQSVMTQLYPRIFASPRNGRTMIAACVGSNLHEIGARMVADFFAMDGWDTLYLGAGTAQDGVLRAIAERKPELLALSVTLSIHVRQVADLIADARACGSCARILVGGPPFNSFPDLWREVGADGYACDAAEAVSLVSKWNAAGSVR